MTIIERRHIEHGGRQLTVSLTRDDDATPHEGDCYSDADIRAWRDDRWQYVCAEITDGGKPLSVVGGIEYGRLADVTIDMDHIVAHHVADMLESPPATAPAIDAGPMVALALAYGGEHS